jgi:acetyltransferase-like isoleucine patch superfamily enzyme
MTVPHSSSDVTIVSNLLTPTQNKVAQLWRTVLHLTDHPLEPDSDFFDLGGHSMVAARFVSSLRTLTEYRDVTMIDVYKYRKLDEFSERLEFYSQKSGSSESIHSGSNTVLGHQASASIIPSTPSNVNFILKYIMMFISMYLVFSFASMQLLVPYLMYNYINIEDFTSYEASQNLTITISDLLLHPTDNPNYDTLQNIYGARFDYSALSLMLVSLVITWTSYPIVCIAAKWIILGRTKPGVYPLYGFYYWRWWIVHRMTTMLPLSFFKGSPLLVYIYRAMGAKIGKNVYMGTGHVSCLDMITIGDNTSIGIDVHMHGYTVKMGKKQPNGRYHGWLIIGPCEIGSNCYIGSRTHLSIDSIVPDNTGIAEFSMVPEDTVLESGKSYAGSPIEVCDRSALCTDFADIAKNQKGLYPDTIDARRLPHWLAVFIQAVFVFCMMLVFMAALIPGSVSMVILINNPEFSYPITSELAGDDTERTTSIYWLMAMTVMLVVSFIFTLCMEVAAIKWILLGRSKGTRKIFHLDSWLYARKWFVDCLMQLSLAMLHSLYATLFLPVW